MLTLGVVVDLTAAGPATVAGGLLLGRTELSSSERTAPVAAQARLPGSVIVTASLPSGSMVILQRSFRPLTSLAPVTSPLVSLMPTSWCS